MPISKNAYLQGLPKKNDAKRYGDVKKIIRVYNFFYIISTLEGEKTE